MLLLKSKLKGYSLNLPTELNEITPKVLEGLVTDVKVPKYHAIVALCYKVKLNAIAIKDTAAAQTVTVFSLLAKANPDELKQFNLSVGDKLILHKSAIEMATHLNVPTVAQSDNVTKFILEDRELQDNLLKGGDGSDAAIPFLSGMSKSERERQQANVSPTIILLAFKIVGISDIKASLPVESITHDPFRIKNIDNVNIGINGNSSTLVN